MPDQGDPGPGRRADASGLMALSLAAVWAATCQGGPLPEAGPGLGWDSPCPVEPAAGHWCPAPAPDPIRYRVPAPPANNSARTLAELAELRDLTARRTAADIAQIRRWSVEEASVLTHWLAAAEEMAARHGLSPPAGARLHAMLSQAVYTALVACWRAKYTYKRPRPSDLDPEIDTGIIPVPQHPAYPSGHSTVAGAASALLLTFFPREARRFRAMARDSGLSRLNAGVHFRSDHTAGLTLGRSVARDLLRLAARDGGPLRYA